MTNFCPYECGIISIIEQYLLPAICGELGPKEQRSDIAEKHDLTFDQEVQVYAALKRRRCLKGNRGKLIISGDVLPCLDELQVAPSTTEELLQLLGQLDRFGTGLVEQDDVLDMLAERLSAKARHRGKTAQRDIGHTDPERKMLSRGIRAELYKLNVYSDLQIGSLVVCLPVTHQGGALAVRHSGREVRPLQGFAYVVSS
jgi:hypothetical protein